MQSTGHTSTHERSLMSMHGSAMMYVTAAYSTVVRSPSISPRVRSKSADLATTWSKPAACAPRDPAVSEWFVEPITGTCGYVSLTSSGSIRATSAITRSGGSTPSAVWKRCSGTTASSFPRTYRSTPSNRIVAMVDRDPSTVDGGYQLGLRLARSGEFFEAHE